MCIVNDLEISGCRANKTVLKMNGLYMVDTQVMHYSVLFPEADACANQPNSFIFISSHYVIKTLNAADASRKQTV